MFSMEDLGKKAKKASFELSTTDTAIKNQALINISNFLIEDTKEIICENQKDISMAKENGIKDSMIDRLMLNEERIKSMASACLKLVDLQDPIGNSDCGVKRPNGMNILKVRVPLGVVGIIFESRPNVTIDAGCLCLKSGNACILRGGKEAIHTNIILVDIMRKALKKAGLNEDIIQLVKDTNREHVKTMASLTKYIDVLIPRGGMSLIQSIKEIASVPFIETGAGNCHIYIDKFADIKKGVALTHNGKTQRVSVCNSLETVLIHKDVAREFLPLMKKSLDNENTQIRGCSKTKDILGSDIKPASEEDYYTEYNDYIITAKVVDDIDEAIEHINKYSTKHSECIVTKDIESADLFTSRVDSACVYVNVSTRFTDGEEFGFGAEIGISTQKTLPRGPMGLTELTTIKYIITGNGQTR